MRVNLTLFIQIFHLTGVIVFLKIFLFKPMLNILSAKDRRRNFLKKRSGKEADLIEEISNRYDSKIIEFRSNVEDLRTPDNFFADAKFSEVLLNDKANGKADGKEGILPSPELLKKEDESRIKKEVLNDFI